MQQIMSTRLLAQGWIFHSYNYPDMEIGLMVVTHYFLCANQIICHFMCSIQLVAYNNIYKLKGQASHCLIKYIFYGIMIESRST